MESLKPETLDTKDSIISIIIKMKLLYVGFHMITSRKFTMINRHRLYIVFFLRNWMCENNEINGYMKNKKDA